MHMHTLHDHARNYTDNRLYAIFITSHTRLMVELIFTNIDAKSLPTVKEARAFKREQGNTYIIYIQIMLHIILYI